MAGGKSPFNLDQFTFYDLNAMRSHALQYHLQEWGEREVVVVLSPHDDDCVLGAGYAMLATATAGAEVHVIIFNDGSAGYSDPAQAKTIVATRKEETKRALKILGIPPERIRRLEIPDFSGMNYLGWQGPGRPKGECIFEPVLKYIRSVRCTRLFLPNGYREHQDHCAASITGIFDGIQAGDPVLVDWGTPTTIKTFAMYSVWGAFSPLEEQIAKRRVIGAKKDVEDLIRRALLEWKSQQQIIADLFKQRDKRWVPEKKEYIEVYLGIDPRPRLDLESYKKEVAGI